jgi:hypothetical protein
MLAAAALLSVALFAPASEGWGAPAPTKGGAAEPDAATVAGEAIYRRGVLSSGAPLEASRSGASAVQ